MWNRFNVHFSYLFYLPLNASIDFHLRAWFLANDAGVFHRALNTVADVLTNIEDF